MSNSVEQVKLGYLARIDEQIKGLNGHAGEDSNKLRLHARQVFENSEFPGRKSEDWKYTSVRPILSRVYPVGQSAPSNLGAPQDFEAYTFHFINGILTSSSSNLPDGVYVGKLSEAWSVEDLRPALEKYTAEVMDAEMGPFESMGLGLSQDPMFMYVRPGIVADKPIHFIYETNTGESGGVTNPYHVIAVDRSAQAEIIETFASADGTDHFTNPASRIFIEANAKLEHYRLQNESYSAFHTAITNVKQQRDSKYGIYIAELGSKLMRNNIKIEHLDQNIGSDIYGLFVAQENQHIDTQSFIDHAKPHCESNELYKGILLDRGRGVFNGKIIVRPDAQKINAYQQNAALILSKDAVMDSKPQLEIYADDVRCSHGATIGQLDPESLFYLKTRGLNDAAAKALLKRAFLKDVVDNYPNEDIANYFLRALEAELDRVGSKAS